MTTYGTRTKIRATPQHSDDEAKLDADAPDTNGPGPTRPGGVGNAGA